MSESVSTPRSDFMRASEKICTSVVLEPGVLLLDAGRTCEAYN
jgi:hypothetical protein